MFLCETLLLVLLKLLILHFGLFAVVLLCVFRKENGLTVKEHLYLGSHVCFISKLTFGLSH